MCVVVVVVGVEEVGGALDLTANFKFIPSSGCFQKVPEMASYSIF